MKRAIWLQTFSLWWRGWAPSGASKPIKRKCDSFWLFEFLKFAHYEIRKLFSTFSTNEWDEPCSGIWPLRTVFVSLVLSFLFKWGIWEISLLNKKHPIFPLFSIPQRSLPFFMPSLQKPWEYPTKQTNQIKALCSIIRTWKGNLQTNFTILSAACKKSLENQITKLWEKPKLNL